MAFQMLLCGERYENIYTRHTVAFGIPLWALSKALCSSVYATVCMWTDVSEERILQGRKSAEHETSV
jgi:hypothetical protein